VLAIVTAVVDAGGANRVITAQALAAYRPALEVITGISALGVVIALGGLAARPRRPAAQLAAESGTPAGGTAEHDPADCVPAR